MMKISFDSIKLKNINTYQSPISFKEHSFKEIAITGIAGIFPKAGDIKAFWDNLISNISTVSAFPTHRKNDIEPYLRQTVQALKSASEESDFVYHTASYLDEIDKFDYTFFRISPREAALMNPIQRLFLQVAWNAIEDAGYGGERLKSTKTGVFTGHISDLDGYKYKQLIQLFEDKTFQEIATTGNLSSIIPGRISYLLDLKGPSMLIDTACSSSLVALHTACQSLRNGDCDQAIVGGVKLSIMPVNDGFRTGIESPDGITRTFDAHANGTGIGEGAVAVMIKPLAKAMRDKDRIYAVIKGSAINQDGYSMGITSPNTDAQKDVIINAWKDASINPETIGYIEAHGTGTPLGDPIEINGLKKAFEHFTNKKQFCAIGSVKSNIGHLYEIAGLAGIVKAALALDQKYIPATIHFQKPNPNIDFEDTAVYVADRNMVWENNDHPRRCGVSSFGFSGTNCHVVLEEAPVQPETRTQDTEPLYLLPISAASVSALVNLCHKYKQWLATQDTPSLLDICYTASVGRGHYQHRMALLFKNREELIELLNTNEIVRQSSISKQILYAHHTIRKSGFPVNDNELTPETLNELNTTAANEVNKYANENSSLCELASLYVKGAAINWEKLYAKKETHTIGIPVYPFDKLRCWVSMPEISEFSAFHNIRWKESFPENNKNLLESDEILFISDNTEFANNLLKRLKQLNSNITTLCLAKKYRRVNNRQYSLPFDQHSFELIYLELEQYNARKIIFANHAEPSFSPLQLSRNMDYGLWAMVNLLKSSLLRGEKELFIISRCNGQDADHMPILPENAALFALVNVIGRENPKLKCKCVDTDDSDMDLLLSECHTAVNLQNVKFRKNKRYTREFYTEHLDIPVLPSFTIKPGGVYIITGGTGGLGLETAQYLASKANCYIILVSRSVIPPKDNWDNILSEHTDGKHTTVIKKVREIERKGSSVYFFNADISKEADVKELISQSVKLNGSIQGIIHAAGIAGAGFLAQKNTDDFCNVIRPKITGTWLLYHYAKEYRPDFMLLYSSVLSVLGLPGQSDYTAANAYLDEFAGYYTDIPVISVNWPAWKETGMAVKHQVNNVDTVFKSITTANAITALDKILRTGIRQAIVGELNTADYALELFRKYPFTFSQEIQEVIKKHTSNAQPVISGKDTSNISYSRIEETVRSICQKILGYPDINIHTSFFDLGADSILLTRIFELLNNEYPGKLTIAKIFAYPSIKALSEYLGNELGQHTATLTEEIRLDNTTKDIAIIGTGMRMPMANTANEFWELLKQGTDFIADFPSTRSQDTDAYVKYLHPASQKEIRYQEAAYLEDIDKFDYEFFKLSPHEARFMDPNQRLFLQTAYATLEDAGYGGNKLSGTRTGVYVGYSSNTSCNYIDMIKNTAPDMVKGAVPGNLSSIIPSRISYLLNLRGPGILVDTACSSALVSVHLACKALQNNECDYALAGGIKLKLLPLADEVKIGIESSSSRAKTFDESSDGTGMGEGIISILLKPLSKALEDNDNIYAVIKGSAVNQDGASVGITAPNGKAQTDVLEAAWKDAGIHPESISFIEAHGTGTQLGDPIEIDAITDAFRKYTDKPGFCAIGSVKSNTGHLLEAAGIAGLVKAILALKNKQIPPTLHFSKPNLRINFIESPVYVNDQLLDWDVTDHPRRCGVSSFGFSGTNCHVVLEEAPARPAVNHTHTLTHELNIFTLSARRASLVLQQLEQYRHFLQNNTDNVNIADICYTANTGRGHYAVRMAITCHTADELLAAINLAIDNFEALVAGKSFDHLRLNIRNMVDSSKKELEPNDITDLQQRELTQEAQALLSQTGNLAETIEKLATLYTAGADINWALWYQGQPCSKISLPTYTFEKSRCWLDIPQNRTILGPFIGQDVIHPLLEHKLVGSIDQDIYTTEFSPDKHFVLSDHIILGSHVVPGTTHIEIAIQLAKIYFRSAQIEISDLKFVSPIMVEEGESRNVQIVINKGKSIDFKIVSENTEQSAENWVIHATGNISVLDHPETPVADIKELLGAHHEEMPVDLNELTKGFMTFGPRWGCYKKIYKSSHSSLAEISMPTEFFDDLLLYHLHPSLLDMATAAEVLTMNRKFLPLSYKTIKIYGPTPTKFYSYLRMKGNVSNDEVLKFDISLVAPSGKIICEITDFTLRKADDFKKPVEDSFYSKINWAPATIAIPETTHIDENILLFKGSGLFNNQLADQLRLEGKNVIIAEDGAGYWGENTHQYTVPRDQAGYNQLFADLKDKHITSVVHTLTIRENEEPQTPAELNEQLHRGVFSLFYMARAIHYNQVKDKITIYFITPYAENITTRESVIFPHNAAAIALAKVIDNEFPNLTCKTIDIDHSVQPSCMVQEIKHPDKKHKVAYRLENRYIEELDFFDIQAANQQEVPIKENGTYLITGGTGALGLIMAGFLSGKARVNLCLLARTVLPPRDEWHAYPTFEDKRIARAVKTIMEIEQKGSAVQLFNTDISDEASVCTAISSIKQLYGRIDGILHCAGIAGNGLIINKDETVFKNVIAPKIMGTWLLHKYTKACTLDFFVLFSSVASLIRYPGQSDYTAGNAYMDSFAGYLEHKHIKALSVNWPAWQEAGMAVDHHISVDTLYKTISTTKAMEAFESLLTRHISNAVVGEFNYEIFHLVPELPVKPGTSIEKAKRKREKKKQAASAKNVRLKGKTSDKFSDVEVIISNLWAEVLGLEEIDIYKSFFDLGGDSLIATQLLKKIETIYPGVLDIADIFSYSSVSKMSEYIQQKIGQPVITEKVNIPVTNTKEENQFGEIMDILDLLDKGEINIDEANAKLMN